MFLLSSNNSVNTCTVHILPSVTTCSVFSFGQNKIQAGAELGQAQLKLQLGFTLTYLHQIDEQETLKRLLVTHLQFTATNSLLIAITKGGVG